MSACKPCNDPKMKTNTSKSVTKTPTSTITKTVTTKKKDPGGSAAGVSCALRPAARTPAQTSAPRSVRTVTSKSSISGLDPCSGKMRTTTTSTKRVTTPSTGGASRPSLGGAPAVVACPASRPGSGGRTGSATRAVPSSRPVQPTGRALQPRAPTSRTTPTPRPGPVAPRVPMSFRTPASGGAPASARAPTSGRASIPPRQPIPPRGTPREPSPACAIVAPPGATAKVVTSKSSITDIDRSMGRRSTTRSTRKVTTPIRPQQELPITTTRAPASSWRADESDDDVDDDGCICPEELEARRQESSMRSSPRRQSSDMPLERYNQRAEQFSPRRESSVSERSSRSASPKPKHPRTPTEDSELYQEVVDEMMTKGYEDQINKVDHQATKIQEIDVPWIDTPSGREPITQLIRQEKKVVRSPEGETITKYMTGIDTDPDTGMANQYEITYQSKDPKERLHTGALHEVVSLTSSLALTPSYTQAEKNIIREIKSVDMGLNMTPEQVMVLVAEENEDVETTMKIIPPDLIESTPEKYGLKKRLQKLRLNSESVALLEQSVVYPTPTADEEQAETPPETLATIMFSIEKGVTPKSPPNQVFKTLFADSKEQEVMTVSSVTPGPLSDVVVPTEVPSEIFNDALDADMHKSIEIVQTTQEKPKDNIFVETKPAQPKPAAKPTKKREAPAIDEERPPWDDDDLEPMLEMSGAVKHSDLEGIDLSKLNPEEAEDELCNGIEYYLDAEPMQYLSRVQLRGLQLPAWFPGYMMALPSITEVVKITRCPSDAMMRAWREVQPKIFPDDTIMTVDF